MALLISRFTIFVLVLVEHKPVIYSVNLILVIAYGSKKCGSCVEQYLLDAHLSIIYMNNWKFCINNYYI